MHPEAPHERVGSPLHNEPVTFPKMPVPIYTPGSSGASSGKIKPSFNSPGLEKTGKRGSSLPGNFVIWREKIKNYIRETILH